MILSWPLLLVAARLLLFAAASANLPGAGVP